MVKECDVFCGWTLNKVPTCFQYVKRQNATKVYIVFWDYITNLEKKTTYMARP